MQHFDIVFHYDRWWNPQLEKQAEDRAYRMGRKGDVRVFSLLTKNSIDEEIMKLHERKQLISDNILSDSIKIGKDESFLKTLISNFEDRFKNSYIPED